MTNELKYETTFNEQRNAQFKVDLIREFQQKDIVIYYGWNLDRVTQQIYI